MSLRDNDPCNDTYVDILNGYMASSPSIGRYCRLRVRLLTSQTNHLRIVYHTNSTVARNNRFRIMYHVRTSGNGRECLPYTQYTPPTPTQLNVELSCVGVGGVYWIRN